MCGLHTYGEWLCVSHVGSELAGESLLVVEPFLCEAKHSRQSLDSLSLLFQECDYIPLATSHRSHVLLEHTTGHLHSVVLQRLVESSIREFLKGELSSDQLVSCFNERPFREWIAETRPSEIADLVSAHVNREEWSRCWIAAELSPGSPLCQNSANNSVNNSEAHKELSLQLDGRYRQALGARYWKVAL